jgi:hypothetical protein
MADDDHHRRATAVVLHHAQPVVQAIILSCESGADYDQVDVAFVGQKETMGAVQFLWMCLPSKSKK